MAFFSRPQSASSAVKIVNPASQGDIPKHQPRKDSIQRQCRNILIYGSCRFQDKGCIYYHPPIYDSGQVVTPRSNSPAVPSLPAQAVNAPVFVPKATPALTSVHSTSPPPSASQQKPVNIPASPPPPSDYPQNDLYDPYAFQVPTNEFQGLDLNYYDGHSESQQLYQHEYDAAQLDNFYPAQPVFVRQPLNYHLYTQPIPPTFSPKHFISDTVREDLLSRSEIIRTAPAPGLNLPDELQGYHGLVPLEQIAGERRKFGNWYSTVYRATSSVDGLAYCLRRVENYRLIQQAAFSVVETWSKIRHSSIVDVKEAFTTRAFGDYSLVIVYAYHPNAQTLYDAYLKPKAPVFYRGRLQSQSKMIPERTIWSYIVQIALAIKAVHEAGQAVRMIDVTKVLVTDKNRVRIGSCGIVDVMIYDSRQDVLTLQQEDFAMFGSLILALCCNNVSVADNLPKALEIFGRQYSSELKNLALFLTAKQGHRKSIGQVFDMISGKLPEEVDELQNAVDQLEGELMSELENGRLVRLLCKFGFINERPEFAREPRWSETGDRYIIKLFRDYVFHQVDENGNPVVNLSHVLTCLNKLDAGTEERIMLVSRDEQSCLVVSYKEVKACIESAFSDLARGSSTR